MKSFLWTMLINYIWLQSKTNAECTIRYDEERCIEEKECTGNVDPDTINYDDPIMQNCRESRIYISNYNSYCLPSYLTIVNSMFELNGYTNWYGNCIKSLDISDNQYVEIPTLPAMNILAILNISCNLITTAKLSSLNRIPVLSEIDISNNLITEIQIDNDEFAFTSLTKINMSHNRLLDIRDAYFNVFSELQYLDLSHNEISIINAFSFEGVKNLLYLNLAHNKIKEISSSLFRFTKLEYLYLNNNELSSILLADLRYLNEVIEIDLSYNVISLIEKNVFDNMPYLKILNIKKNLVNSMDPRMFFNTTALKSIDLSLNEIRKLPKCIFKGKSISFFDIRQNLLEGELVKGTFEGLFFIVELDISHQRLTSIGDFAFVGLDMLEVLMLNNNKIQNVSKSSFDSLRNLRRLDLSDNQIHDLNFEVFYLLKLQFLSIRGNFLRIIGKGHFDSLNLMEILDVSNNNISEVESFSFKDLNELISFDISNNPLSQALENNTFMGLISLPALDISCTSLTVIKNNSFNEMASLHTLNISHSTLNEVSFNSFINTGNINVLDLSHNLLSEFSINRTTLINLRVLYLDHNLIEIVAHDFVANLSMLHEINLAHNKIVFLYDETFCDLKRLVSFDISYNTNIRFNSTLLDKIPTVQKLNMSGIGKALTFNENTQLTITDLDLSKCNINNVTTLRLRSLQDLNSLSLNNNEVQKLEVGAFTNLTRLRFLDLSHNNLFFVQPGVFKDNYNLNVLKISHNNLNTISYGIFSGLSYLAELDLSYNKLVELKSERFYGVQKLNTLIADFNKISSIEVEEFPLYLSVLSIGGNLIHCDNLMKLKQKSSMTITAITLDVSNNENIDGVSCIGHDINKRNFYEMNGTDNILIDIRDILLNLSVANRIFPKRVNEDDETYIKLDSLETLLNQTIRTAPNENNGQDTSELIRVFTQSLKNITHEVAHEQSVSNSLLERILKMIVTLNTASQTTSLPVQKYNTTNESIAYMARLKQDFDSALTIEKEKILAEVSDKILLVNKKIDGIPTVKPSEKLTVNRELKAYNSSSLFTEICVALILTILLCFTTFKIYKHVILSSRQRSYSTQHITDSIGNSNL
ncbi:protein artichoke [Pieris rapae]|uniref:protein artichoke n=1 Tax=Pieris rapae TaxID=64459 RepID=UPI001E27A212|nr:protein artichoke [Pieris rapae]